MLTDYKTYSDVQLLQRYQKGDKQAGSFLFQRYSTPLHRFFKGNISGNNQDAEDLVQETFLEALKSLKKEQSLRSFRAWLYKIATRVLVEWIKEKQGRHVVLDAAPEDELLPAPVTDQPEHGVLDKELGDIRRDFERTLRLEELVVFQLRHNSGMTFEEIGKKLRIKTGTAKVRYHRALVAFKTRLKKNYPDIYYFLSGGGE